MIIFDTNVIIEYLKGNKQIIEIINECKSKNDMGITFITEYELLKYITKNKEIIYDFLNNVTIIQLDNDSIIFSAEIFNELKNEGKMINENDILIAGMSLKSNNVLITMDSDFKNIDNKNIKII